MDDFDAMKRLLDTTAAQGTFLVTGTDRPNVMTIGWVLTGFIWRTNVIAVPVRKSRYSHALLDAHKEFTLFAPSVGMSKELGLCGSKSGRTVDKIKECGFVMEKSQTVAVPHIQGKGVTCECRVLYETDLDLASLDGAVVGRWYSGADEGNAHTLYFSEVKHVFEA